MFKVQGLGLKSDTLNLEPGTLNGMSAAKYPP